MTKANLWSATDDLPFHFPPMGIVLKAVCRFSKLFGCEPTREKVASERHRRKAEAELACYAKVPSQDADIECSVMDSTLARPDSPEPGRDGTRDKDLRRC